MRTQHHPLRSPSSGTQRALHSWHFGSADNKGPHVYLQASLHADELPGMLVLQHLKRLLVAAEAAGHITGQVTIVPMANPIGLDQTLLYAQLGRFELASGKNFNRHYPDMASAISDTVAAQLGDDETANKRTIRQAMQQWLAAQAPASELDSLRLTLLTLACEADVVLDLHCDFEASLHLYVEAPYLDQADALMRYLGAQTVLWAEANNASSMVGDTRDGLCFDEALSSVWWRLRAQHPDAAIPMACLSSTVELRGQADVSHPLAEQDARNVMAYLTHRGVLSAPSLPMPVAACVPTPLAGSQTLCAPHAGVLVYQQPVGAQLAVGDVVAQVIDPLTGHTTDLRAEVAGALYARHVLRWATTGLDVAKIAGPTAFKTGQLLSA